LPQTPLGDLRRSPDLLAEFYGVLLLRKKGKSRRTGERRKRVKLEEKRKGRDNLGKRGKGKENEAPSIEPFVERML